VGPTPRTLDGAQGVAYLIDVDFALHVDDPREAIVPSGTPIAMSPEAVTGIDCDRRTDIYSLGVTLFHALTSRYPIDPGSPYSDIFGRIVSGEVADIRDVARGIDRRIASIVMRCLARLPSDRYATMADVADEVESYLRRAPL